MALRYRSLLPRYTTFAEGSELEHDDLVSMRNYTEPASLETHALISDGVERPELVRASVPFIKPCGA